MKTNYPFLYIIFLILLSACGNAENKDATNLCSCYTKLHRERNEAKVIIIGDSCHKLYSNILKKYEKNEKGKLLFNLAYQNCQ